MESVSRRIVLPILVLILLSAAVFFLVTAPIHGDESPSVLLSERGILLSHRIMQDGKFGIGCSGSSTERLT
jgi:hypothetical protein